MQAPVLINHANMEVMPFRCTFFYFVNDTAYYDTAYMPIRTGSMLVVNLWMWEG